MPTPDLARRKRFALLQIGMSAFIGVLALVVLQTVTDRGPIYWLLVVVAVSSAAEFLWFLIQSLRASREAERVG